MAQPDVVRRDRTSEAIASSRESLPNYSLMNGSTGVDGVLLHGRAGFGVGTGR